MLSSSEDSHCMNCRHAWNTDFLNEILTKTFVNTTLKQHRQQVLYDRELSMMAATQPAVVREKNLRDGTRKLAELTEQYQWLQQQIHKQRRYLERLRGTTADTQEDMKTVMELKRNCPETTCKGFLNKQWQCELCQIKVCSECHVKLKKEQEHFHKCKDDDIATAKLIAKQCKSCPSCNTSIFKTEGCDQMWCTVCKTAFSWRTGDIETGRIHNPHFYEWMRTNNNGIIPREPGDIPCGGLPYHYDLNAYLHRYLASTDLRRQAMNIHMILSHIEMIEVPTYRVENRSSFAENMPLRIKYMMNEMNEAHFKVAIQRNEKARERKRAICNLLDLLLQTGADMFRRILTSAPEEIVEIVEHIILEFRSLNAYVTEHMEKISKRYSCVVPTIDVDRWVVIHSKH
jgi:hypothetical protein